MRAHTKKINFYILLNFFVIALIGLAAIFSASQYEGTQTKLPPAFVRQIVWIISGLILMIILSQINHEIFEKLSWILFGIMAIALVFVLFKGGANRRWISFGALKMQPSEFIKLPFIMVVASYLASKPIGAAQTTLFDELKYIMVTGVITVFPVVLILIEPDLGSSLIFPVLLLAILFMANINFNLLAVFMFLALATGVALIFEVLWLENITDINPVVYKLLLIVKVNLGIFLSMLLVLGAAGVIALLVNFFGFKVNYGAIIIIWLTFTIGFMIGTKMGGLIKPYQRDRILTFVKPEFDTKGSGWNVFQSRIAIGSGMNAGKGFLKGTQHRFRFLPERHTDFIFSVIGEEFGFSGAIILIALYLILIFQIYLVAFYSNSVFGKLVAAGVMFLFIFHIVENIGMAIGILPVTGLPLPMISYGGSSFLSFSAAVGVILNISKQSSIAQD
ncbi:MAG TPA: rod shape-determining protein RodA [Firmicutes bacterium]|nr:rod shape-determining protein RodA [Bacillota bacterium]